jgi:hypothetical protein
MASTQAGAIAPTGPVLLAYDGSELAALAIEQAGRQLVTGRDAPVVCVWQPADVGFVPIAERHFDADQAPDVRHRLFRRFAVQPFMASHRIPGNLIRRRHFAGIACSATMARARRIVAGTRMVLPSAV